MTTDEMLDRLLESATKIRRADGVAEEARVERDRLIRMAVAAGLGATVVANYAGLTRQSVYNVVSRS